MVYTLLPLSKVTRNKRHGTNSFIEEIRRFLILETNVPPQGTHSYKISNLFSS